MALAGLVSAAWNEPRTCWIAASAGIKVKGHVMPVFVLSYHRTMLALLTLTVGFLSFGLIEQNAVLFVTSACARRIGAAARVKRRLRER